MPDEPDDREEWPIKVFRDDPCWDACEKWWMVPQYVLRELYVTTVIRRGYGRPTEESGTVRRLRQQYPGHVFVY